MYHNGCNPSSDKVEAIASVPQPVNKKELQSFIGMVNYLSKFTPRLSELAECLYDLILFNVLFQWGLENTEAFTNIKQEIIPTPVLKYYDHKKPTVLQKNATLEVYHNIWMIPKELQAYWTFREEMTVEDGLILKATRIVIPSSM